METPYGLAPSSSRTRIGYLSLLHPLGGFYCSSLSDSLTVGLGQPCNWVTSCLDSGLKSQYYVCLSRERGSPLLSSSVEMGFWTSASFRRRPTSLGSCSLIGISGRLRCCFNWLICVCRASQTRASFLCTYLGVKCSH